MATTQVRPTAAETPARTGPGTRSPSAEVAEALGVDTGRGLDTARGRARGSSGTGRTGSRRREPEPRWRAFVRQYRDPMQIVLLVAGIGSLYPLKELGTGLVLLFLTLFNAVLGLQQEGKAAEAVAALQKMMIVKARVRRDGELLQLPAEQLVPGDVVAIEAGDLVPADGRLLSAATLEVDESALTGESMPVSKGVEVPGERRHAARRPHRHGLHEHERHPRRGRVRRHGDRDGDRGRPHLAACSQAQSEVETPLTRQLAKLTTQILSIAGVAVAALGDPQPRPRRGVRHRVHGGDRVRDRRDPDRACRRS